MKIESPLCYACGPMDYNQGRDVWECPHEVIYPEWLNFMTGWN